MSKTLIAYFSRAGNNYVSGAIKNLKIGNTEKVARMINDIVESDMFHIETEQEYPSDYSETTDVAKKEQKENARPRIKGHIDNMDEYDTVFIGYPNWWGTCPMAVFSFLDSYELSGKKIVPFCTHEGSGMGRSESDIKKECPESVMKKGLAIHGSTVDSSRRLIESWIKDL